MGIILLIFWECLVIYKLTELGAVGVVFGRMHICLSAIPTKHILAEYFAPALLD